MSDNFRKVLGRGTACRPADKKVVEKYRSNIPVRLLKEWKEHGWCSYAEGLFWTVNPDEYRTTLKEWFPKDKHTFVFARGAFGDLLLSRNDSVGHLNVHYGRYVDLVGDIDLFLDVALDNAYITSALDGNLARKAMKKLGPVGEDEMFTFEPALALGGAAQLKYVRKVKMFPQLAILSQLHDEITIE